MIIETILMTQYLLKITDHIDHDERDKKYRDEAKDGDDIKGWLPLYHGNGHNVYIKGK